MPNFDELITELNFDENMASFACDAELLRNVQEARRGIQQADLRPTRAYFDSLVKNAERAVAPWGPSAADLETPVQLRESIRNRRLRFVRLLQLRAVLDDVSAMANTSP